MRFSLRFPRAIIVGLVFTIANFIFYTPQILSNSLDSTKQIIIPIIEYTPQILPKILSDIKKSISLKETPVVVFDLDDTLINTRERNSRILQNFAKQKKIQEAYPMEVKIVNGLQVKDIKWSIELTLKSAGISDLSFISKASDFWNSTFYTNAYCCVDKPNPGAVAYVQAVYEAGATVVYLTGREEPAMTKGTQENLKNSGFPLEENRTLLLMKSIHKESGLVFKKSEFPKLKSLGTVIASFENEPINIDAFQKGFPQATMVFINTIYPPDQPSPNPGIFWIENFVY